MTAPSQWRAAAEAAHVTHRFFDHLGARQIDAATFEVWLALRNDAGDIAMIRTQIDQDQELPTLADLWSGAQWCEREASEGYALTIGVTEPLLIDSDQRGVMRQDRLLSPRQQPWPGSHEPSGKSRLTPMGRA
jgi:hypothetical protein